MQSEGQSNHVVNVFKFELAATRFKPGITDLEARTAPLFFAVLLIFRQTLDQRIYLSFSPRPNHLLRFFLFLIHHREYFFCNKTGNRIFFELERRKCLNGHFDLECHNPVSPQLGINALSQKDHRRGKGTALT